MSRSIHTTKRDFRGLTRAEIDEQLSDPRSDLRIWARKCRMKNEVIKNRRYLKQ